MSLLRLLYCGTMQPNKPLSRKHHAHAGQANQSVKKAHAPPPPDATTTAATSPAQPLWTPTQIQKQLEQLVQSSVLSQRIHVAGEMVNCSSANSGHMYFDIRDEHANKLSCTLFCAKRVVGSDTLATLRNGTRVVVSGHIRCVSKFKGSQYQLNVRGVRIHQKEDGLFEKQLHNWKRMLAQEGLFDDDRKRALPRYPVHIAIVTASEGAVLQDIRQTLENARVPVELTVCSCAVQGQHCVTSVLDQLQAIGTLSNVDMVLIARGGGSREDLWEFNQPLLLRGIDAMRGVGTLPPIACAIGHQTDHPLLDTVCDASFITPTYAAQHIVSQYEKLRHDLRNERHTLHTCLHTTLHALHTKHQQLLHTVQNHSPHHASQAMYENTKQHILHTIHTHTHHWSTLQIQIQQNNKTHNAMCSLHSDKMQVQKALLTRINHATMQWTKLLSSIQNTTPWSVLSQTPNCLMLDNMNVLEMIQKQKGTVTIITRMGSYKMKYSLLDDTQ